MPKGYVPLAGESLAGGFTRAYQEEGSPLKAAVELTTDCTDSTDGRGWNKGFRSGRTRTLQVGGHPNPGSRLSVSSEPSAVQTVFSGFTAEGGS